MKKNESQMYGALGAILDQTEMEKLTASNLNSWCMQLDVLFLEFENEDKFSQLINWNTEIGQTMECVLKLQAEPLSFSQLNRFKLEVLKIIELTFIVTSIDKNKWSAFNSMVQKIKKNHVDFRLITS